MNIYSKSPFHYKPFPVPEMAAAHSSPAVNFQRQLIAGSTPIISSKCNITRGYFKFREGISPYERAFIMDIK